MYLHKESQSFKHNSSSNLYNSVRVRELNLTQKLNMNSETEMIRVFPTLSLCFTCLARCTMGQSTSLLLGGKLNRQLRLENSLELSHSGKKDLVTEMMNLISSATTTMKYNFSEVQTTVHIFPMYV